MPLLQLLLVILLLLLLLAGVQGLLWDVAPHLRPSVLEVVVTTLQRGVAVLGTTPALALSRLAAAGCPSDLLAAVGKAT